MLLRSVRIVSAEFDVAQEWTRLRTALGGQSGAILAFCGLVRDQHQSVSALTLEHYPGMTEASIERIIDEAEARWPLDGVSVIHRVGKMLPAEQIVLVLTASAHRDAAFAACQFVMDYLKTEAVFWKKEAGAGGSRWVESTADDLQRASEWKADETPKVEGT